MRGRFCPIDQIREELNRARERANARGALLLAADNRVVLGTLCMCVPERDPNLAPLAELLRGGELLRTGTWVRKLLGRRRASLPELIRTTIPARNRERVRFPETAEDLIKVLAEIAKRNQMMDLGEWLDTVHRRWVPARIPLAARRARVSTAVLFLEAEAETREDPEGIKTIVADHDIIRLTECVNATVQADVRRDDLIMRLLDGKLSSSLAAGEVDFAEFATDLLELAALGSDSEAGACYLIDPSTQAMTLEAFYLPQHLAAKWKFAERLPAKGFSIGTVCAKEGQAIQLPPGLPSVPGLLPTCRREDGVPEPTLELATPMPGPLGSPSAPAIGAMTLVKLGAGHEPFGAYEVALSRNGALRLALISATTKAERAAHTFTSLSRDATHLRRDSLATDMMLRAQRQTSDGEERGINKILPDDLEVVLPVIQNVLTTLAEVTQSETVTFRAALPDPDATEPHGMSLARVAAFPPALEKDEEHAVQADDGDGVNWKVACEGSLVYESDVLARKEAEAKREEDREDAESESSSSRRYVEHHRNTRSELCVPVFVEDRVVGVVNLESPVPHAYDAQIDIAQALAEHVGTAIANARLVLAGVLQSQARDILRKSHDLSHAHEDLRKIARNAPHPVAREVDEEADRVQREAEGLLTFIVDPHENPVQDGGGTFPDLLDAAREKVALAFDQVVGRDGDWVPYPSEVADLIVKALVDILDNARRNHDPKKPQIELALRQCVWGGQTQDILEVRICTRRRLRASRAINVYRCPLSNIEVIYDDFGEPVKLIDHPQLGAYLAGTHARRAGGEVHLTYLNGSEARVVFSVPSPKEAKHVRV